MIALVNSLLEKHFEQLRISSYALTDLLTASHSSWLSWGNISSRNIECRSNQKDARSLKFGCVCQDVAGYFSARIRRCSGRFLRAVSSNSFSIIFGSQIFPCGTGNK